MDTDDNAANVDGPAVEIALRVPGPWASPEAFDRALPEGYRLGGDGEQVWLYTPPDRDGGEAGRVPLMVTPFDAEFVSIFASSVDRLPSEMDREGVESHAALVCPHFPGGTPALAAAAVRHTAALIRAGGFGVFVDNSSIAHGSDDWLTLADDTDPAEPDGGGGPFWAFVNVYGSPERLWSIGMHVLGHRDATLDGRSGDDRRDDFTLRNFLAYASRSGETIADGHLLDDQAAEEQMRVKLGPDDEVPSPHPMHNPFGRFFLERMAGLDTAEPIARGPA